MIQYMIVRDSEYELRNIEFNFSLIIAKPTLSFPPQNYHVSR